MAVALISLPFIEDAFRLEQENVSARCQPRVILGALSARCSGDTLAIAEYKPEGKCSLRTVAFNMVARSREGQLISMLPERAINLEHSWKSFLQANCNSMFQTALLLSANARAAEAALADSIGDLDLSNSPDEASLAIWERAVMKQSIGAPESRSPAEASMARSMLQPGLRSVIDIERCPRICFVLHLMRGYKAVFCAQMLGIAESEIPSLLQRAVTRLCGIVTPA